MVRLRSIGADGQTVLAYGLVLGTIVLAGSIAVVPLPVAAGLTLALVTLVLALVDPLWALCAAILSVPVQELVQLPGGLSLTQACLLLAAGALIVHVLAHPERPLRIDPIGIALAGFVWCLGLSAALTPYSRAEALRETLRWTTVLLIYLLAVRALDPVATTGRDRWRLGVVLVCLLAAPAANALYGIGQYLTGDGPPSFVIDAAGRVRAYGTIGQPNSFAGYVNQAWPLVLAPIVAGLIWLRRRCWGRGMVVLAGTGATAAILLFALLVSFSRGGWLGAVGGTVVVGFLIMQRLAGIWRRLGRRLMLAGMAGVGLVIVLGGVGLLPDALARRVGSIAASVRLFDVRGVQINPDNFAVVERMAHLQAAWNMFGRYPLTGVGPGNYSVAFEYTPRADERSFTARPWYESRGHAHNYYLHIAAETGAVGGLAYVSLLLVVGRQAWRALAVRDLFVWSIVVGAAGVVASVVVHNLFENLHVLNMGIQLATVWALLGVGAGYAVAAPVPAVERNSASGHEE
jgi:O-antigen ligase